MWPLWTLLCQPTRFAGGGKTSVAGRSERGVTCLSAVPFFTEAGDVYVFAYKIKKSTLAFHGTLGPHIVTSFVSPHRSVLIDLENCDRKTSAATACEQRTQSTRQRQHKKARRPQARRGVW